MLLPGLYHLKINEYALKCVDILYSREEQRACYFEPGPYNHTPPHGPNRLNLLKGNEKIISNKSNKHTFL